MRALEIAELRFQIRRLISKVGNEKERRVMRRKLMERLAEMEKINGKLAEFKGVFFNANWIWQLKESVALLLMKVEEYLTEEDKRQQDVVEVSKEQDKMGYRWKFRNDCETRLRASRMEATEAIRTGRSKTQVIELAEKIRLMIREIIQAEKKITRVLPPGHGWVEDNWVLDIQEEANNCVEGLYSYIEQPQFANFSTKDWERDDRGEVGIRRNTVVEVTELSGQRDLSGVA